MPNPELVRKDDVSSFRKIAIGTWRHAYLRKIIGVFFQVVMTKVEKVRARKDVALEKTRKTFLSIPYLLLNKVLSLMSFFSFELNLDLRSARSRTRPWSRTAR